MANETIPDLTAGTPPFAPTTLVELAVPDGLGGFVSRKGPLVNLVGSIPLASGTISVPVAYLDLALPAGYSQFKLSLTNIITSADDALVMVMSTDGGVTFINDTDNFDSYFTVAAVISGLLNATTAVSNSIGSDALMDLSNAGNRGALGGGVFSLEIYPGDADTLANATCYSASYIEANLRYVQGLAWAGLNPDATVAPVPARINAVRIQPYGTGHANPPNSGDTFTCEYVLMGVPTP